MVDDVRKCKRYKIKYKDQDIYLIWGDDLVDIKFAFENRPERKDERDLVAVICEKLTEIKQEELFNNAMEELK